jgi:hypothetical protein
MGEVLKKGYCSDCGHTCACTVTGAFGFSCWIPRDMVWVIDEVPL